MFWWICIFVIDCKVVIGIRVDVCLLLVTVLVFIPEGFTCNHISSLTVRIILYLFTTVSDFDMECLTHTVLHF